MTHSIGHSLGDLLIATGQQGSPTPGRSQTGNDEGSFASLLAQETGGTIDPGHAQTPSRPAATLPDPASTLVVPQVMTAGDPRTFVASTSSPASDATSPGSLAPMPQTSVDLAGAVLSAGAAIGPKPEQETATGARGPNVDAPPAVARLAGTTVVRWAGPAVAAAPRAAVDLSMSRTTKRSATSPASADAGHACAPQARDATSTIAIALPPAPSSPETTPAQAQDALAGRLASPGSPTNQRSGERTTTADPLEAKALVPSDATSAASSGGGATADPTAPAGVDAAAAEPAASSGASPMDAVAATIGAPPSLVAVRGTSTGPVDAAHSLVDGDTATKGRPTAADSASKNALAASAAPVANETARDADTRAKPTPVTPSDNVAAKSRSAPTAVDNGVRAAVGPLEARTPAASSSAAAPSSMLGSAPNAVAVASPGAVTERSNRGPATTPVARAGAGGPAPAAKSYEARLIAPAAGASRGGLRSDTNAQTGDGTQTADTASPETASSTSAPIVVTPAQAPATPTNANPLTAVNQPSTVHAAAESAVRAQTIESIVSAANHAVMQRVATGNLEVPELGRVAVRAASVGGRVDIDVVSDKAETRAVLHASASALASDLRQAEVPVRQLRINGSEAGSAHADGSQQRASSNDTSGRGRDPQDTDMEDQGFDAGTSQSVRIVL